MEEIDFVTLDRLAGPDGLAVTQEVLAKVVAWNPAGAPAPKAEASVR